MNQTASKMTVGQYLGYLTDQLQKDPDLASKPLYSENGILFGWEDIDIIAEELRIQKEVLYAWVNTEYIEGVRSNANVITPKDISLPRIKNKLEEEDFKWQI